MADRLRSALLTGATGYIGSYLLVQLLKDPHTRVICLVRSRGEGAAINRLETQLKRRGQTVDWSRIEVIASDLSQPKLALSPAATEKLKLESTDIFHCAATVRLLQGREALWDNNVGATAELIGLSRTPTPKPFHFLSTIAFLLGPAFGDRIVREDDCPTDRQTGPHTPYARSKLAAERLVHELTADGQPAWVYRIPFAGWSQETGVSNPDDFSCLLLRACIELQMAPDLDLVFDIVPVDVLAEVIDVVSKRGTPGKTHHLGNEVLFSFRELIEGLRNDGCPIEWVPYEQWFDALGEHPSLAMQSVYIVLHGTLSFPEIAQGLDGVGRHSLIDGSLRSKYPIFSNTNTRQTLGRSLHYPLSQEYVNVFVHALRGAGQLDIDRHDCVS